MGESFGLSAAEAICMGIPVVLSDIDAHKELVGDYSDEFTYNLGDSTDLSLKLASVADNYIQAYEKMLLLRNTFSSDKFMLDWQEIM
ncbi:glycosyltransferase [Aeromonas veronii]|nr:glycosyltransferase [Aeromonas veronii]